jgi:hypothetical protein
MSALLGIAFVDPSLMLQLLRTAQGHLETVSCALLKAAPPPTPDIRSPTAVE